MNRISRAQLLGRGVSAYEKLVWFSVGLCEASYDNAATSLKMRGRMSEHKISCLTVGITFWLSRKKPRFYVGRSLTLRRIQPNLTKGETHDQNRTFQVRIPAHDSRSLRWNPSHYRVERICAEPPPTSTDIGAAPTPSAAEAERIIVTGSNIPTAEEVGPNPVDTYNRENINKSGEFTTERFLQSLPIANANIIPTSNNENGSNTAVGAATIALRGFDARATLILLDGRRVVVYPTGNNPRPGECNVRRFEFDSSSRDSEH